MAHRWNEKPNPAVTHTVTCLNCGVTVSKIFVDGKGINHHVFPGGEKKRGLAPRCTSVPEINEEDKIKISNDRNSDTELTPASHELFMEFANDADNWSGTVPTDGNVQMTNSQRGNLTHLKKLGLVTTEEYDGSAWVNFTDKGIAYAGQNGVDLTWIDTGARDAGDKN